MNFSAHRLHLRTVAALVSMAFAAQMAWAVSPFTVRDIRVEGLQRVEPGTVFASLPAMLIMVRLRRRFPEVARRSDGTGMTTLD